MTLPPFERDTPRREHGPRWSETMLAQVTRIGTGEQHGLIAIEFYNYAGPATQEGSVWARVAMPLAGNGSGAFLLPRVGDEVLVTLVGGDPRQPVVIGSLWNGRDASPETLGSERVDRWSFTSPSGTHVRIHESSAADSEVTVVIPRPGADGEAAKDPTAARASLHLSGEGTGSLTLRAGGSTIVLDAQGIRMQTSGEVCVDASTICQSAMMMDVQVPLCSFAGITECATAQSEMVVSTVIAPAAGSLL